MIKKLLGNSGMDITRVGFGAWAIGGAGWKFGWGEQEDKDSIEAIHKSLDMGINWIDTAAVYGTGLSEEIVAKAIGSWSGKKPYIFTKCVMVWDENRKVKKVHDSDSIKKECEDSLRRLKVDAIDLYQMHWPPEDDDSKIDAAWEAMAQLKEEGKVKNIGLSNFNVRQMKRAQKIAPITSLQPPYNLIKRNIEKEILPFCQEEGIGVIVYSPMMSGLLTGAMTKERAENLPDDDWRKDNPEFNEPKLSRNLRLVEKLEEIAEKNNRVTGEIAIAWTLKHPAVTAAIVGARSRKQAEGVMSASEFKLSDKDANELESFFD